MRMFNIQRPKRDPRIEVEYKSGVESRYTIRDFEGFKTHSLGFRNEKDAKMILSIIDSMIVHGVIKDGYEFPIHLVRYIFQMLGIKNEWTE